MLQNRNPFQVFSALSKYLSGGERKKKPFHYLVINSLPVYAQPLILYCFAKCKTVGTYVIAHVRMMIKKFHKCLLSVTCTEK
jgi:hypothetical protein